MPTPRITIDALPEQGTIEPANLMIVQDGDTTKKIQVATLLGGTSTALTAHLANPPDAHTATAVSATPSGPGVDGTTVQAQLGQLVTLVESESSIIISDTPPAEHDVLWADTADETELAADTVSVFTYTDESDLRPDATVVFWIPDPYTLGDPFGAIPGDCVLRSTPNVVQGLNGISGLWQGTPTEYEALPSHDASTIYFVITP